MDIISEKTQTLLRDKNVRDAVEELLNDRTQDSKTVKLTNAGETGRDAEVRTKVRIRRIA